MSDSFHWQLSEFKEIAPTFYTRTAEDRKGNLRKKAYSPRTVRMTEDKLAIKDRLLKMELHDMFSVRNINRREGQTLVNNIYGEQKRKEGDRKCRILVSSVRVQGHITFVRTA
jgi:hypothetical protein